MLLLPGQPELARKEFGEALGLGFKTPSSRRGKTAERLQLDYEPTAFAFVLPHSDDLPVDQQRWGRSTNVPPLLGFAGADIDMVVVWQSDEIPRAGRRDRRSGWLVRVGDSR